MLKNKNYKYIIGLILGVLLSATGVYATTTFLGASSIVSYDNTKSGLSATNAQGALDELYSSCPEGYICQNLKTTLSPGDYISYTPTITSYTTDTTKTGYDSTQTINPSELNLWRVLSINNDGTVDIISEDVSSEEVFFRGETGYRNLVGYLNVLASQYENPVYTVGSRHFGYNGQTEYITTSAAPSPTYFSKTPPWICSTGESCNPDETKGGGDTLYESDFNLVNTVLGTGIAKKVGTLNPTEYWMASRYYDFESATIRCSWAGRLVSTSGSLSHHNLYHYDGSRLRTNSYRSALRPIVTLKSGLAYEGSGTKDYPMEIIEGTS